MSDKTVLASIAENKVKFVDLRFTDTYGKEQHMTLPASQVDGDLLHKGKPFDGSSIAGWRSIDKSDMVLLPDTYSAVLDPFTQETTLLLRCDVVEPNTLKGYERDPRSIARRAEDFLKSTGVADEVLVGPEAEFFVFDDVRWGDDMRGAFYEIDSAEAHWNSAKEYEDGNKGHRPAVKGGYFPVPPVDSLHDVRSAMALAMEEMGLTVQAHHHEVATAGQGEIGVRFNTLVYKADETQIYKYCVHNVAASFGLTATFMPKPLVGDNGTGMHVHQSLRKGGANLFKGDGYAGLSETALHYIGGLFKHARALNALTNAATNSYKRLVPGFEAPVMLAYSAVNRSASCRIPYDPHAEARRVEVRFPDAAGNPYLSFTAMLMAGLDGVLNKIHPGDPVDKNLYELSPSEQRRIKTVARSLDEALEALDNDREFLKAGDVMNDSAIDAYLELKSAEVERLRMATHPVEFDMYFSR